MSLFANPRRSAAGALLVLSLATLPSRTDAISDENDRLLFGPVGVSVTEGVRVNIHVPQKISARERELLEALDAAPVFRPDTGAQKKGFFGKVFDAFS